MEEQIKQLQEQIDILAREMQKLRASATIPYDIGEAFKVRVSQGFTNGTPNATTNGQAVNESGSASYTVSALMNGMFPVVVNGITYNLPYYN